VKRLWISGIALLLDQVSKWLVTISIEPWTSVPVLGDFFRLTFIHNPGAVFGIRFGEPWVHLLVAVAAMAAVCRMLWTTPEEDRWAGVGLALVLGGAAGNVADRLELFYSTGGAVVDFLDFGLRGYRWYIFNIADACVTSGVGLLLLTYGLTGSDRTVDDGGSKSV